MGTSITDGRYTSLHFTEGHILSLSFDEPPETGWGVMPGYDESLDIPAHLHPPNLDADEILPSQMHPSYPYGRPPTASRRVKPWMNSVGNLLGTVGSAGGGPAGSLAPSGGGPSRWRDRSAAQQQGAVGLAAVRWGERWDELAMAEFLETRRGKEIPPGMAGAKRPPSPPAPAMYPHQVPRPRSQHVRNQNDRDTLRRYPRLIDMFDAPVPNETYILPADLQQRLRSQLQAGTGARPTRGANSNTSTGSIETMGGGGVTGIAEPTMGENALGVDILEEMQ